MFTANADRFGPQVSCVGPDVYRQATNTTPGIDFWWRKPCWRLLLIQGGTVKITPEILTRRRAFLLECLQSCSVFHCTGSAYSPLSSILLVAAARTIPLQ